MPAKPIYVEIEMHAPLEELWRVTQTPGLHARWDLRFTDIDPIGEPEEGAPMRFRYATRLGFGLRIEGWGESVGGHEAGGVRSSALRFGSEDPKSMIVDGSGYWKYVPGAHHVRFLTLYDYRTRFGVPGAVVDRLVFRPLIGWATAWSFDRLRLWLERGIDPALSAQRAIVDAACRAALAFVFLFHGLVPKLILGSEEELELIHAFGFSPLGDRASLVAAGVGEVLMGLAFVVLWRRRWVFPVAGTALILLLGAATYADHHVLADPFNPLTFTAALLTLCAIGWVSGKDLPRAARCARHKGAHTEGDSS